MKRIERSGGALKAVFFGCVLVLAGGTSSGTPAPATAPPAATAASTPAPTTLATEDIKIGYISGGDADPFVFVVTQSIRSAAAGAGVQLFGCDSNFDDATALNCARTIGGQGAQAVINWHFTAAASASLCEAYNQAPTVSMDTTQEPCQKVFVGADGHKAGLVAGKALGDFAKAKMSCAYDLYISIVNLNLPDIVEQRDGGSREGFEGVCGAIPTDKYVILNKTEGGADRLANVRRIMTDILTTHPDAKSILVMASFGDGDGITAFEAAKAAGRDQDVWVATHGADASACDSIRNNPQWVGSVAYFPESYGGLAVPAAIKLARGEAVDAAIYVDHQFVTKDNIDKIYPACF